MPRKDSGYLAGFDWHLRLYRQENIFFMRLVSLQDSFIFEIKPQQRRASQSKNVLKCPPMLVFKFCNSRIVADKN